MREMKFRAWDKKRKKMIYYAPEVDPKNCGDLVYCDMETLAIGLNGQLYLLDECGHWKDPKAIGEDYVIMQYTGLKDKNGKEIYEGDICKVGETVRGENILAMIYWDEKKAGFGFELNMVIMLSSDEIDPSKWEVIGNKHENPNLLELLNHKRIHNLVTGHDYPVAPRHKDHREIKSMWGDV